LGSSHALSVVARALTVAPLGMYFVTYWDILTMVSSGTISEESKISDVHGRTRPRDIFFFQWCQAMQHYKVSRTSMMQSRQGNTSDIGYSGEQPSVHCRSTCSDLLDKAQARICMDGGPSWHRMIVVWSISFGLIEAWWLRLDDKVHGDVRMITRLFTCTPCQRTFGNADQKSIGAHWKRLATNKSFMMSDLFQRSSQGSRDLEQKGIEQAV